MTYKICGQVISEVVLAVGVYP